MEKEKIRNLSFSLSLTKAKEWNTSGIDDLVKLAKQAYTEEELTEIPSYENIEKYVNYWYSDSINEEKSRSLNKLINIAKYYNRDWVKGIDEAAYIICKNNDFSYPYVKEILNHNIISGCIYFKNREDALKAIKILGDEINLLF